MTYFNTEVTITAILYFYYQHCNGGKKTNCKLYSKYSIHRGYVSNWVKISNNATLKYKKLLKLMGKICI